MPMYPLSLFIYCMNQEYLMNKKSNKTSNIWKWFHNRRQLFWSIVITLALGSRPRQRGCKVAGQEEGNPGVKAKALQGCGPRGSLGVSSHTPGSVENVRECEGVNTHTPKATSTLGDGVLVDSQNFIERFEGSKLNGLWRSLYHWKDLET
jgi:hypothetical protein